MADGLIEERDTFVPKRYEVSLGFLKGSHRSVDPARSPLRWPLHPHPRSGPITPVEELDYQIGLAPIANLFLPGHPVLLPVTSHDQGFHSAPNRDLGLGHAPWQVGSRRILIHWMRYEPRFPSQLLVPILGETLLHGCS